MPEAAESYVLLAGAMHEAFAARLRAVADPDFVDVPIAELISPAWAEAAAERIRSRDRRPVAASVGGEGTTHVSTYDADGNAVALTHTLGIFSGVIVPGTGIALNSGMDLFDPHPGRPQLDPAWQSPRLGYGADDRLRRPTARIVSGAPGTNAIVTSVLQVIVGLVDGKLSPVEAVSAPRVHCEGGPVFVEGRVSRAADARRWPKLASICD